MNQYPQIIRRIGFAADGKKWNDTTPAGIRTEFKHPIDLVSRMRDQILAETADGFEISEPGFTSQKIIAEARLKALADIGIDIPKSVGGIDQYLQSPLAAALSQYKPGMYNATDENRSTRMDE